ncbi:MAG: TonB-dependent receptor [Acidobacteria bacterium]|nr:TonB-dependent receptor [Acidobacteriota bacterium]
MYRALRTFVGVQLVVLLGAAPAWAQATAQINGTVTDSSGGVLPGATVVAIQTETGFRRETTTSGTGSYALLNLPLGPYRLEVSLSGFRSYVQTGIVLQVNSNPVIPVTLQLGSLQETVSVEAAAPLVETRNPAIGSVVDNEQVEALPLEGRNPVQLITLAGAATEAGIQTTSRSMTTSRGIAITGGQPFAVSYLLDGAMHNNVLDGLNLPLPFPDALQEFSVETSSQNAQNGRQGSGTVNVVTKSGTNLLHGDLFEFARHHRFNATSPFAAVDRTTGRRRSDGLVRNQYGGTLGGPIATDRLFFFGAIQDTRATQTPADIFTLIPSAAMLQGDFTQVASAACRAQGNLTLPAALGFVNNRIDPALLSPAAVNISRRLPTTTDPCGRITYSRQTKPHDAQGIARIDWQISQSQSLFGRYMRTTTFWEPALNNSPDNILVAGTSGAGGRDNISQSLAVGYTQVLSSTMVNNVRFVANRTNVHRTNADMFDPREAGINIYTYVPKYTVISTTGAFGLNFGTETDSWYRPNTYGFSDDLTLVRGNHQWGVGVSVGLNDWKTHMNIRSTGTFNFNGNQTGLPLADFLLGRVFEFRQAPPFEVDIKQKYFGLYGQDTWKLSSNVTLNYGVRWEPWFPQQHQKGQTYNFDINRLRSGERSTVYPIAPSGLAYPGDPGFPSKAGMYPEWANLQPRVGLAWDPFGDGRTSVRAGYGMNSNFISGEFYFDAANAPPFGLEQRLINPGPYSLDDPWRAAGRVNPFPFAPGSLSEFPAYALLISVPYDLDTTRVHSWNVGIQRQIGDTLGVSASYLGNYLANVWGEVTGNPGILPAGLASPTSPCTLRNPASPTGTTTYPNCSAAPTDVRRELTQANPAVGRYIGYLDWITDKGWQRYHGLLLSFQRRSVSGISANANYTWSTCRGLINQGGTPLNVGTGYMLPVSLINPPANIDGILETDEGPCSDSPTHVFNLTASVETPQFANAAARAIASGWRLSGIFRAYSGLALSVMAGSDRALSGMQYERATQVGDNPYGAKTKNNWFNAQAFAQPPLGTYGTSERNGYRGMGTRVVDLALVRSFRFQATHRLEARVEAFNAFNGFRPGPIDNNPNNNQAPVLNLANPNFGRYLVAGDPRIMQFALKYSF